jgi:AraC-like DNA-binding protein
VSSQKGLELASVLANVFEEVRMSAALTDGRAWRPLYYLPDVLTFEVAHGVEARREVHNARSIASARRSGRAVVTAHAGFHDLFVPVGPRGDTVLVTGPFSTRRPTSAEVQQRWRWLTRTHAHAGDPELGHYLAMTLGTATFEGPLLGVLLRFAVAFCQLLTGSGSAEAIAVETRALREKLATVRFAERSWEAAADMVDERTARTWASSGWTEYRRFLGCERLPTHAVVGVLAACAGEPDPIDEILRRDAFQRAAVELARKSGGVVCGRVGGHGVVLLVDDPAKGARVQKKLLAIGDRARTLARRFRLTLHVGIADPKDDTPLPTRHQTALAAAHKALTDGQPMVIAEPGRPRPISLLGVLRRGLGKEIASAPGGLGPRFDRYLETAAAHAGHRLEPLRAYVEAAFDQIVDALQATGALDERSLEELRGQLERAGEARTVQDYLVACRTAISDVQSAVVHPRRARHDRSIRRATDFIREHLGEALPLRRVARVAGFEANYFSKLFAATESTTFTRYVRRMRVERAKQMLESTALGVERIGPLCGFRTRPSFHRAFLQVLSTTPGAYRKRAAAGTRIVTKKS